MAESKDSNDSKNHSTQNTIKQTSFFGETFLTTTILLLAMVVAFLIRAFSVVRYESVIHEFDPWFNYRVTQYIVKNGFLSFFHWFDKMAWYPQGRDIYKTTYYGMMFTSAFFYRVLQFLHIPVHIREICVFNGPVMAMGNVLVIYHMAKIAWDTQAGLFAATFVAVVPGFISRSMAGSYDYESSAIFVINLSFLLWMISSKSGSIFLSILCGLSCFYITSIWGGYIFVINLIAVHAFLSLFPALYAKKFNREMYISYTLSYSICFALSTSVPIVMNSYFEKIIHLPPFGVFVLYQLIFIFKMVYSRVPKKHQFKMTLLFVLVFIAVSVAFFFVIVPDKDGGIITGRIYHLFGIAHNIDIVKSVSEHQRGSFRNFQNDINLALYLAPVSCLLLASRINSSRFFLLLYFFFSAYFAVRMVRVLLVFSPICCIFAGICSSFFFYLVNRFSSLVKKRSFIKHLFDLISVGSIVGFIFVFLRYLDHSIDLSKNYYSSPSIILSYRYQNKMHMIDDYREALLWLRMNTPRNSKVLSWWDYGYQITGMANRTVYVDNNTNDYKHISLIGRVLAYPEHKAYKELINLDADYIMVLFGGKVNYSSDDVNKAYWIFKITSGFHDDVKEMRNFNIDENGKDFKSTLLFKMVYYRFDEVNGYDYTRRQKLTDRKSVV